MVSPFTKLCQRNNPRSWLIEITLLDSGASVDDHTNAVLGNILVIETSTSVNSHFTLHASSWIDARNGCYWYFKRKKCVYCVDIVHFHVERRRSAMMKQCRSTIKLLSLPRPPPFLPPATCHISVQYFFSHNLSSIFHIHLNRTGLIRWIFM